MLGYIATVRVLAAKATGIWTANMKTRRMMVERRTGKKRPVHENPLDFTGYGLNALSGVLFWQGFFIIVFKIGRNTPSLPFILSNFYANGVPNSAIRIFSRYFMMLKCNSATY